MTVREDPDVDAEVVALRADVIAAIARVDELRRQVDERCADSEAAASQRGSTKLLALSVLALLGAAAACWLGARWNQLSHS